MPLGLPNSREMGRYFALAQVGLEMVVPIVLGVVADSYLGWTPWGVVLGVVVGFVGGLAHLLSMLKRFENERSEKPPDSGE
jgi:F0F1-type ATP synthase assembly protein I